MHVAVIHPVMRQKRPVASGQVDVDVDVYAGTHGCPSVIAAATSPGYPCRCPLVTGHPAPSVVVVVEPTAVVEGRPTPGVVRYPCVPVIGHHPIPVGCVRMKVPPDVGNPHAAISAVVDPPAVRPQLIVKDVE